MKKHFNILNLKNLFLSGENVSQIMRETICSDINTNEIIETAYDLQSGTYIDAYNKNLTLSDNYQQEKCFFIKKYFPNASSMLDCGCGELSATSLAFHKFLSSYINLFYAFDISLSRLIKGKKFFFEKTGCLPECFNADIENIPLSDNFCDIVTTSHALEPNHGKEKILLAELLRVSKLGLVLFEPSWELGGTEQQERMRKHGYIRNLPNIIKELPCTLIYHSLLTNQISLNNKTAVYIIKKDTISTEKEIKNNYSGFVDPILKTPLITTEENFLYSEDSGRLYPIVKGIPVLRKSCSILATHYLD